jgi:NAD(P)H-hydrate epimerase
MAQALNAPRTARSRRIVVSVDMPSGCRDDLNEGAGELVHADITLAVEPVKQALYTPFLRTYCGRIVPVRGIFPPDLLEHYGGAELADWRHTAASIPPVPPGAHKYNRGLVEIHAGDYGSCGAARIAAKGAQAAGAGLVRLVVDDELYPVLAAGPCGIMVAPASKASGNRFQPDALLLGPGWGTGERRLAVMKYALEAEARGVPLILDADAIMLAKECFARSNAAFRFHGRTVLTPHTGELTRLTGIPKDRLLSNPNLIRDFADKYNAVILFKSHVMIIAAPAGAGGENALVYVDGMTPSLAAGGSGDLLAGFCAAIAARLRAQTGADFSGARAAVAAACLLAESARRGRNMFGDPLDLAHRAMKTAGAAWLERSRGLWRTIDD